ncbi:MAG: hypothetical protein ACPGXZ_06585 [Saprospiraceae bacterium]
MNPAIYISAIMLTIFIINHYVSEWLESRLFKKYMNKQDHIVVIGLHPKGNKWFTVPPDTYADLCIFVPQKDVAKTVEAQKALLRKSGNDLFENPKLKETDSLHVLSYVFQDGANRGENWTGYEDRTCDDVMKKTIELHTSLSSADHSHYYKNSKGIAYDTPKQWFKMPALLRAVASLF